MRFLLGFTLGVGVAYVYMRSKQKVAPVIKQVETKVKEVEKEMPEIPDSDMSSLSVAESDEDGFHYDIAFAEGNTKFKVATKDKDGNITAVSPVLKVQEVPFEGYQVVYE